MRDDLSSSRLNFGVIGAGRVGPIIGSALASAGHKFLGITQPSLKSRERVDLLLPGVNYSDSLTIINDSELVILALPDSELEDFVGGMSSQNAWRAGQLVLHTSMTHGLDVLNRAKKQGVIPISLYPLMEFTGTSLDFRKLQESWCVVSAPPVAEPIVSALAVEMGMEPVTVDEEGRAHAASAIALATSFFQTTIQESADRMKQAGVKDPGRVLHPLVLSLLENAFRTSLGEQT